MEKGKNEKYLLIVICEVCGEPLWFKKEEEKQILVKTFVVCCHCKQRNTINNDLREFIQNHHVD